MDYFILYAILSLVVFSVFFLIERRRYNRDTGMFRIRLLYEKGRADFTSALLSRYIEKYGEDLASNFSSELAEATINSIKEDKNLMPKGEGV